MRAWTIAALVALFAAGPLRAQQAPSAAVYVVVRLERGPLYGFLESYQQESGTWFITTVAGGAC